MQHRVHANVAITPTPVEERTHLVTRLGSGRVFSNNVADGTAFPANGPGIAGLTAAHGIEDSPVEDNDIVVNGDDAGVAFLEIGVLSEQVFGYFRPSFAGANSQILLKSSTKTGPRYELACAIAR